MPPTLRIACLHTADSNVQIFDDAATEQGLAPGTLVHAVRADLLAAAERARGLAGDIVRATRAAVAELARDAHAVLLNCSTLGPCISEPVAGNSVPVLRADAALARATARAGRRAAVLYTAPTTHDSTRALFDAHARLTGCAIEVRAVAAAWDLFRAGNADGYCALVAHAANAAYAEGFDVVALAQTSMTAAARLVTQGPPPLTVPAVAVASALAAATGTSGGSLAPALI